MKNNYLALVFLCMTCKLYSQINTSFKLSDLQTPDAPGFILADKAPASVQKPTNPKTFGIDLLSLHQGGAVQATPYWFFQHPDYDVSKYLHRSQFIETLNLSVATFKTDTSSVVTAGIKTLLLRLYSKQTKAGMVSQDYSVAGIIAKFNLPAEEKLARAAMDSVAKIIDSLRKQTIFKIEFAGAYLGSSSNNSFNNLLGNKAGIWLNFDFSPFKSGFDLLFVSRYLWSVNSNAKTGKDSSFFDYGVAVSYQKSRFDGSLECVNRRDMSLKKNYDRFAFIINFKLSDEITLVSSLGKDFSSVNNIFSLFGAKFGIGSSKVKVGPRP